ncbi:hypothetical protein BCR34DRAFT_625001 [Clohesyomyces aquaticus]|uniref:Glycoside hydrolase family 93 protein n=1 Tax=Clohesyomyces aquaticus TaxID=1231657 RepID=A0A1Y1ZLD3_9PLEO|nr:hypothetical protein BCR34DRAFT_625001 [Clohesyomyces aquaticus]
MAFPRLLALGILSIGLSASRVQVPEFPELQAYKSANPPAAFSFTNQTIIYAPVNNQTLGYPRVTELSDGSLLVASTLSGDYPAFFPICKSVDDGVTWNWLSNVGLAGNDTTGDDPGDESPIGLGAQPHLLQLKQAIGQFPAGAILATGNRMGMESTNIDLYASKDAGKSWQFVTTIAQGGPPTTDGVIAYYSDSRDENHAQKLSHQTSDNLIDWADPVDDVAYPKYEDRPGMTVVAYIPPLAKYMLVYEHGNGTRSKGGNNYPDSYKLAADPLLFNAAPALAIEAKDGLNKTIEPGSAPYVTWSPVGGVNGTIIVTDANHKKLFINRKGGAVEGWETRDIPQPHAYARALHVLSKYPDHLMVIGAGPFRPKQGDKTPLSVSLLNITALVESSQ